MSTSAGAGRTPLIAGNWKMHKTIAEAKGFIEALLPLVAGADRVDVGVCPPFPALMCLIERTMARASSPSGARSVRALSTTMCVPTLWRSASRAPGWSDAGGPV